MTQEQKAGVVVGYAFWNTAGAMFLGVRGWHAAPLQEQDCFPSIPVALEALTRRVVNVGTPQSLRLHRVMLGPEVVREVGPEDPYTHFVLRLRANRQVAAYVGDFTLGPVAPSLTYAHRFHKSQRGEVPDVSYNYGHYYGADYAGVEVVPVTVLRRLQTEEVR